ncbi:MAG: LLM class flavin-dependent oxidoreductase [Chloroflexi bacterium]|nr:LLM class flavin-dependent oxidoreductase [Chloroflexota bacterium]MYD49725.1 LLM class flavin-dependent oxidoreductase [Chloroflexota bacterium]
MQHVGLVMECDYREGRTQDEAFAEAFEMARLADETGIDGVWLAERHFAAPRTPTDPGGAGIPSVSSVPLLMAGIIAARTERVRVGTGVSVLPLAHPIRLAEEAATVDNISQGRLDFGIGRSSFPRSYHGYDVPYDESRERFAEALDIILKAWNNYRFDHHGHYYNMDDVVVTPRPYQQPHPPIRIAANSIDTFGIVGQLGFPLVTGVRGQGLKQVANNLELYRAAVKESGHDVDDVYVRMPIYVAESMEQVRADTEESTMRAFRRTADTYIRTVEAEGENASAERRQRAEQLLNTTYDDLLVDRVAYGSPEEVAERLTEIRGQLGLTGVIMEPNLGGTVPVERVQNSVRLYAEEVAPALRG